MKWWKTSKGRSFNAQANEVAHKLAAANRVIAVVERGNGNILIAEECDGHFSVECTRQEAIEIFKEIVNILEGNYVE